MELVLPSAKYKESFLEALKEYQQEKSKYRQDLNVLNVAELDKNFQLYINKLADESAGKNLPAGYIPHTNYWLVNKDEFIGRVDIRHSLTEKLLREGGHIGYDIRPTKRKEGYGRKILKLALLKAKALGITKVLITCDENNFASKKIIEGNGGIFENSLSVGKNRPRKLRYWITLPIR